MLYQCKNITLTYNEVVGYNCNSTAIYSFFQQTAIKELYYCSNFSLNDPALGRMLSPDNYITDPRNPQAYNRYTYCLNNPLVYTDPDGEFIQYIIGAVIGGFSSYMMADNLGYKGWDKFWYTLGGAAIGAATAGIGTAVSFSAGVVAGGVVGGAVGGAGFGTMGSYAAGLKGDDLLIAGFSGMWQGAVTGLVGSFVGGAIGGGWGALAGGATSNLTWQLLANDFSFQHVNLMSIGVSGAFSFGMYHLVGAINYQKYKSSGVTFDGKTLSYRQFMGMSADFQRSKFWKKEYGGFLVDKKYIRYPAWTRHKYSVDIPNYIDENTWATFHTHWDEPGIEISKGNFTAQYHTYNESGINSDWHADKYLGISSIVINRYDASYNSIPGQYTTVFSSPFYRYPYYFYLYGY